MRKLVTWLNHCRGLRHSRPQITNKTKNKNNLIVELVRPLKKKIFFYVCLPLETCFCLGKMMLYTLIKETK